MLRIVIGVGLKLVLVAAPLLLGACRVSHGDRCNPSQFADDPAQGDCESGYECVYPTAAMCGVAYCCKVDDKGNVADSDPNCQPDPTLSCAPDLSLPPVVDMTMAD